MKLRASAPTARAASRQLRAIADPARAKSSAWFFKTGPGEYGEGDRFLGIPVPQIRAISRTFQDLPLKETRRLLTSSWHEERLLALLILVRQYQCGEPQERKRIYRFYLTEARRVNNWDLVDSSAPYIVGEHLSSRNRGPLRRLVRSSNLWERRIAVLSTLAFVRRGDLAPTFEVTRALLGDTHDLIQKAAGWMLREAGKRDETALREFLARHAGRMPRTMLRYAIERFPQRERRRWLGRSTE